MVNLSMKEIKKSMPILYKAMDMIGKDDGYTIDSAYVFKNVNKTFFRQANSFLKNIRSSSVASICKKYDLPKNLPSLENNPRGNALKEFCVGEQRFAESMKRKFEGAKHAFRILGKWVDYIN